MNGERPRYPLSLPVAACELQAGRLYSNAWKNVVEDDGHAQHSDEEVLLPWALRTPAQRMATAAAAATAAAEAAAAAVRPQAAGRVPGKKSVPQRASAQVEADDGLCHCGGPRRGRRCGDAQDERRRIEMPEEALQPVCQFRCCLAGLVFLIFLRGCSVNVYNSPCGMAWTAHMLSCASDIIAAIGASPVLIPRLVGSCVHQRCLGSLLTLLLTATVCDLGAMAVYFSTVGGAFELVGAAAAEEGAPSALAFVGAWECIIVSSVSLQLALCFSAWQFYRAFREAGIYPPNLSRARVRAEVSPLEFLCEAEDVALLSDHCSACNRSLTMEEAFDDRPVEAANVSVFAFAEEVYTVRGPRGGARPPPKSAAPPGARHGARHEQWSRV